VATPDIGMGACRTAGGAPALRTEVRLALGAMLCGDKARGLCTSIDSVTNARDKGKCSKLAAEATPLIDSGEVNPPKLVKRDAA